MRLGRVTTAALALALAVAATAHAAPGGGSSGFGGGGGGGGGGFSSGGGSGGSCGSGCYTISGPWGWIIFVGFFVLFGLGALLVGLRIWRQVKHRKARVARVELAAAEAAQDDEYFEPA